MFSLTELYNVVVSSEDDVKGVITKHHNDLTFN